MLRQNLDVEKLEDLRQSQNCCMFFVFVKFVAKMLANKCPGIYSNYCGSVIMDLVLYIQCSDGSGEVTVMCRKKWIVAIAIDQNT